MKLDQAVEHFGTQAKIAEILGLTDAAVSIWKDRKNGLVPIRHIIKLKDLSQGELDLNLDDYR